MTLLRSLRTYPRRGASLLDYGLIGVLVAVLAIGAVTAIGDEAGNPFADMNSGLNGSASAAGTEAPTPTPTPEPTPEPVVDLAYALQPVGMIDSGWQTSTYPPALAYDGNDSTTTHPDGDPGRTLTMHFQRAVTVQGWRVLQGWSYETSAQSYVLESSSNGGSTWAVQASGGGTMTDESGTFASPVTARTWRLRIITHTGPYAWDVRSVELLGVNSPEVLPAGVDLAATMSPIISGMYIWSGSQPLSNIIDGNDGTYATPNGDPGAGLSLDFGAPVTVSAWRVRQATEYNTSAQGYVIESSNDGSSWTVQASGGGIATIDSGELAAPISARYWRIRITQHSGPWGWDLFTFSLFGASA